jgi:hypothetical protein
MSGTERIAACEWFTRSGKCSLKTLTVATSIGAVVSLPLVIAASLVAAAA